MMVKIRIQTPKEKIGIIKYHLEAEDNLGYLRVLSPHIAVLNAITSKEQANDLYVFLSALQENGYPLTILPMYGEILHYFSL